MVKSGVSYLMCIKRITKVLKMYESFYSNNSYEYMDNNLHSTYDSGGVLYIWKILCSKFFIPKYFFGQKYIHALVLPHKIFLW